MNKKKNISASGSTEGLYPYVIGEKELPAWMKRRGAMNHIIKLKT